MKILNNVSIDNTLTLEELKAAKVSLSEVPGIGELSWNDIDGTADLTLKGGSVVLQIGQEFNSRVYNAESFPLVPGNVVYAYGAINGQTSVRLANASAAATSRNTVGVITEIIPPGGLGFVTIMGKVRELDTSAFMPNETLYLSTVDGQLTNIRPQSPDYVVSIGWVSEVHATLGSIRLNIHVVANADEISYDNSDSGLVATNVKSGLDELQFRKADISLLSSNITLYTTNAASDIGGYYKLVSEVSDPSYNTTPVNITSGPITTTNQLINSFVAPPNLFVGNPGFINISTIGNIRKTLGNSTQYAEFFFRVYKRSSTGVETLVATSNTTGLIQNNTYVEFNATAVLNDGVFTSTDRVVIKHFANILSGSGPVYDLEFGGNTPTRTLFPVPVSVIPAGTASSVIVDTSSFNGILSGSNSTIQSALNTIDDHNHDNRYYTETEIDNMLNGLSSAATDITISDIGNYYTVDNVEAALQQIGSSLQNISGAAVDISISDAGNFFVSTNVEDVVQEIANHLIVKANATHNHIIGDINGLQLALDARAPLASPSLTGTPTAPTAAVNTNTTQLATTAFVNAEIANDAAAKVHTHTISDTTNLQTSLDAKAPLASPALTGVPTAPTAAVNTNTTQVATTAFVNAEIANDAAPKVHTHAISDVTNLQATLNGLQPISEKGAANGYASLGSDGKVPSTQLPSFVDDVLEYDALANFPATGEISKIYIALDTNKTYRWSGSTYVYITSGAVDSVAGKTGVVTLEKADVGLSNVDNTADSTKSVSKAATLTTPRTLTIGSTGKNFDGSANVSWTLAEIGAQAAGSYAAEIHTHGTYDNSTALTGANVYSNIAVTDGIITGLTSRALTASDIGAAKRAVNETTATDGQVLTAKGDGSFAFEAASSASGMSVFTEEFTATEGQTNFTLLTGEYSPGSNRLIIYIWGLRQHSTAFTETSSTTFALAAGVPAGTKILAEWRVADPTLKGDTGPTGPAGPNGEAATVTVGSTTTIAAGSNALVTNSGTLNDAVLNFSIPRGVDGINGTDGVDGDSGVYIGASEPVDPDKYVWIDTDEVYDLSQNNLLELTSGSNTDLHIHDDRYYTETEVNDTFAPKANPTFTGTVTVPTPPIYSSSAVAVNADYLEKQTLNASIITDCNDAAQGHYMITPTTLNAPEVTYGWLESVNIGGGWLYQRYTSVAGSQFTRTNINNGGWSAWSNTILKIETNGIKFPAYQVPSADPNTLDDYEEGTWTPTVGGNATYLLQTGKYVKVGNVVTISMQIAITIIGTGNTGIISGLPFAGSMAGASIFYFATLNGSFSSITAQVINSTLSLRGITTPSNNMSVITPLTSGSSIELSCTYIVN